MIHRTKKRGRNRVETKPCRAWGRWCRRQSM